MWPLASMRIQESSVCGVLPPWAETTAGATANRSATSAPVKATISTPEPCRNRRRDTPTWCSRLRASGVMRDSTVSEVVRSPIRPAPGHTV